MTQPKSLRLATEAYADAAAANGGGGGISLPIAQADVSGLIIALAAKLEAADIAGKADETDPRFTDARTPTAHTHPIAEVTGLQSTLDSCIRAVKYTGSAWPSRPSGGSSITVHWIGGTTEPPGWLTGDIWDQETP